MSLSRQYKEGRLLPHSVLGFGPSQEVFFLALGHIFKTCTICVKLRISLTQARGGHGELEGEAVLGLNIVSINNNIGIGLRQPV